ncbi:MAG: undecaprenyl-diphosphatase UppP [Candidatus Magasanikbacteria bacterium]|nr:undecaprenyl-diphosphatase UppP [Candidatus Magasanikbacteria bacterium]
MTLLQAIVLGLVQGITEFLPISSSGHLVMLPQFFGWEDQGIVFDTLLHGATLIALLIVFWKDLARIAKGLLGKDDDEERRLGYWLIVGSIPAFVAGFLLDRYIVTLRDPRVVTASLIVWGIGLWFADKQRSARGMKLKRAEKLRWHHALGIGAAQAVSLIPGTSRSGITIMASLMAGLDRSQAVRFSFLLGIPVFFGATVFKGWEAVQSGVGVESWGMLLVGALAACLSGIAAIKFLLRFVVAHNLTVFVWYRIILGGAILALFVV